MKRPVQMPLKFHKFDLGDVLFDPEQQTES